MADDKPTPTSPQGAGAARSAGQDPAADAAGPGLVQMVTPIHSVNEQIGQHVVSALQRPGTVALLSTVMPGVHQDRIVSIPLNPQQFHAIQQLLSRILPVQQLTPAMRRAIGFGRDEEE